MVDNGAIQESQRLDSLFRALSDASRRQIIALLREAGELKVTDLADAFTMSLNGVSKHIKVLEKAGLILRRIEGREHWLRVDWTALEAGHTWLSYHQHFWNSRLDAFVEHVTKQADEKPHEP